MFLQEQYTALEYLKNVCFCKAGAHIFCCETVPM